MIDAAEASGQLKPGGTIVEPTSGNTGVALAMVAQQRGYKCVFVCPDKVSEDKQNVLRAYGPKSWCARRRCHPTTRTATTACPTGWSPRSTAPGSRTSTRIPTGRQAITRRLDRKSGPTPTAGSHTSWPGSAPADDYGRGPLPQGGVRGAVRVIGADPEGSVYSGGTGRPYLVEGVGEDFWPAAYDPTVPDEVIAVSDADSFEMTRRLAREEAMLVGGSCGMAVVAALKVAEDAGPDALIVVLLPDGGRGYMSKIFNDAWMSSYGFLRSRLDGSMQQPTVGDVLRGKSGALPDLVHTHPSETVRDAIGILREYGVSQMPVVGAEPPVMAGEVVGSVSERELLSAVFEGRAKLADAVSLHMSPPLPMIGAGELITAAAKALRDADALMVVEEGKPVGVITRHDLLGFLSEGPRRR
ncbi:putative cystathionine beta-synthase [Mycobacterium xenopi 4042]|uniref:Putative cystathionine beta-synthase n=1 Tax=Mycobacterium xenopi 4042 TaxID=1299334 RepID=X8AEB1_MYCXE|nr:putative cystathionine beta-synthase [Mycobacterium xenopi 4042]